MKITDIKVHSFGQPTTNIHRSLLGPQMEASIVQVITDEGVEGYAGAWARGRTSGRVMAEHILATAKPMLLGENPMLREKIWHRLWALDHVGHLPIFALSAIDVALWDIAGKVAGLPVYQLLGGYREEVPAYASSGYWATPEEYVAEAVASQKRGFVAYKIHPFGVPARDAPLARLVRAAVGPDFHLMLDPAGNYDFGDAVRVGRVLEELGFRFFEEPLREYNIAGFADLCRTLDIPIVGVETVGGGVEFVAQYIAQRAIDGLEIDVYWKGGITGAMKIGRLAEAYSMKVQMHQAGAAIMNWANLHVACALRNCDYYEVLVPEGGYDYALREYVKADQRGMIAAPTQPGLGVEIDWDFVRAHSTSTM